MKNLKRKANKLFNFSEAKISYFLKDHILDHTFSFFYLSGFFSTDYFKNQTLILDIHRKKTAKCSN